MNERGEDSFEPLFIGVSNRCYGSRLKTSSIRRIIKDMIVANGYISKQLSTHSLRHTALTYALKGGASLQETKELGRHSDINTTLIYAHNINRIENAPEFYVEKYLHGEDIKEGVSEEKKEN
jgi:site-specific recombinase XerD